MAKGLKSLGKSEAKEIKLHGLIPWIEKIGASLSLSLHTFLSKE